MPVVRTPLKINVLLMISAQVLHGHVQRVIIILPYILSQIRRQMNTIMVDIINGMVRISLVIIFQNELVLILIPTLMVIVIDRILHGFKMVRFNPINIVRVSALTARVNRIITTIGIVVAGKNLQQHLMPITLDPIDLNYREQVLLEMIYMYQDMPGRFMILRHGVKRTVG